MTLKIVRLYGEPHKTYAIKAGKKLLTWGDLELINTREAKASSIQSFYTKPPSKRWLKTWGKSIQSFYTKKDAEHTLRQLKRVV